MQALFREVVGKVFRQNREEQCRTVAGVARSAGISRAYYWEVEQGKKEPSSEMIEVMCGALGLSVEEMLLEAVAEYRLVS